MSPEVAITEIGRGLQMALLLGAPPLLAVLLVGVTVGIIQAATQINEQTIGFVMKAIALVTTLALTGHFLEQFVFHALNKPLPPARVWMIERLAEAGRL